MRVLTLERQPEYGDHVRGEIWPWGVRVARRLNLERLLLDAGAKVIPRLDLYDEGSAEPLAIEIGEVRVVAGPAAQLARQAPGGNYLAWPNQIAVNVDELNLRRRHTSLLQRRHDLVLGEALELFS